MKTIHKILAVFFTLVFQPIFAQNLMVIHQGNGTKIQLPIESIDSIRFATLPPPVKQKIFQKNGNVLVLSVSDIDSITYDLPDTQSLPQVSTVQVVAMSSSSIYAQGSVQSEGSSAVTQRGFCWSLQPMPSLANNFTITGIGIGSFGATITPLQAGTLYYVRAYASNNSGTAYGSQLTINTQSPSGGGNLASITTNAVQYTPEMGLTAVCGGNVSADGGLAVTARGVCWAAGITPTLNHNFTVDGFGAGSFTSNLTGLQPNTQYFVRAYATNDAGTVYGVSYGFTTIGLPQLSTIAVSNIFTYIPVSGGNISADGGAAITARGVCWSMSPNPTIALNTKTNDGTGTGSFTSSITSLNPNTLYYVRAYATNSLGTAYGNQVSFTTTAVVVATLNTTNVSLISLTSASTGGNISNDGGGNITARGVVWSTIQNPTIALTTKTVDAIGSASFTSNLTGLSPSTLYYVRSYATNSAGTAYGNEITFTTLAQSIFNPNLVYGTVNDNDGNTYKTIVIGTQTWMAENLKVSKYRNGAPIPTNLDNTSWQNTTSGAYAIYDNDAANNTIYGKLYNWYAVVDSRNLCPVGWHVPSDPEWKTLEIYLGMSVTDADIIGSRGSAQNIGGKLKSTSTLWSAPNTGATNESGFSGLPGGFRDSISNYLSSGSNGTWWSSTELSSTIAWARSLSYDGGSSNLDFYYGPSGFSVRCLRD